MYGARAWDPGTNSVLPAGQVEAGRVQQGRELRASVRDQSVS